MTQNFSTVITDNQDLNRVQSNITNALNPSSGSSIVVVSTISLLVPFSGCTLMINTLSIPQASSTVPVQISLPDATQNSGFIFYYKKTDTTSNPINFITSFKLRSGQAQLIENAASPFQVTASLAKGNLFSDGSNWWVR